MTEMFGEAWPPKSVPDLAPDDDDDDMYQNFFLIMQNYARCIKPRGQNKYNK